MEGKDEFHGLREALSAASEEGLRKYLAEFDDGRHEAEMRLLDEECRRRTETAYDSREDGEWI